MKSLPEESSSDALPRMNTSASTNNSAGTALSLMEAIGDIGRDPVRGGYSRPVYSGAELSLREWFLSEAQARGLEVRTDRNGIIWAWYGPEQDGALVTGSHLDSVPGGGAFDGPLGVAAALAAVDELRARAVHPGQDGRRSLAITVFPEEEGSRFGVACLGSRLLTGAMTPERALALKDSAGDSLAEIASKNALDPQNMGADPEALAKIGHFVELHVEQGLGLVDLGPTLGPEHAGRSEAVAIGGKILGHGRWKFRVTGQGNHAGTTLMTDRADPMVVAAQIILATQTIAQAQPDARATVGRVLPIPGGTNVIASAVELWLDLRHPVDAVTTDLVRTIHEQAQAAAVQQGCAVELTEESFSPTVGFHSELSTQLAQVFPTAPLLDTGAGHDAGVLAAYVPSAMLFIRNPSGISHSPEEYVEDADVSYAGLALADALEALL